MTSNAITTAVSNRICKHMNNDHQDALISFAKHYGGFERPVYAKMIGLTPSTMKLNVDGELIEIAFDHNLTDSEDAHKTLVSMLKAIPKE